jgi:ribonuclease D
MMFGRLKLNARGPCHLDPALLRSAAGSKDFLIDCLALRQDLRLLKPVLSNPRICKVVHGGGNDVVWLQRDFGLFLVNCFDTEKACQARTLQG